MITKIAQDLVYSPPWELSKIPEHLHKCPVHSWRAKNGIELIHKEPTKKELHRIIRNFKVMPVHLQEISDRKSIELFGVRNLEHAKILLNEEK